MGNRWRELGAEGDKNGWWGGIERVYWKGNKNGEIERWRNSVRKGYLKLENSMFIHWIVDYPGGI